MNNTKTLNQAEGPNPSIVPSGRKMIPDYANEMIAEGERDDKTFDKFFALVGEELLDDLSMGLRQRFIRLMADMYIADDTISDDTLAAGLRQIQDAAMVLEDEISFAIQAEILSHVRVGPATSLNVSIAQELRETDW